MMVPVDDEHFEVNVKVAVSRQFFGWVIALGEGVKITEPENVVEQMKDEIHRLEQQYL
jgi:predicted DNA-binding transcriptional regulator YafY